MAAVVRKSGGRPSKLRSGQMQEQILDAATSLFLEHGYGASSIEKVAFLCGMSKRTFYHRFENKEELFAAVVHRLIGRLRPSRVDALFEGKALEIVLTKIADALLHATLAPEALALHRILLAEATRFPQLASVMEAEGSKRYAIEHIADLLRKETATGRIHVKDPEFAAEQFMHMVMGVPQRRALGMGTPMTPAELTRWRDQTVRLFLSGCGGK